MPCRPMRPLCSGVGWTIRNTAELKALSFRRRSQIRRQKSSSFPNSQRPETKPKDGPRGPIVPKQSLEHSGEKLAESAEKIKRSTHGVQDSAARTTELAADRTVFAAERTYAAWVRTGLMALCERYWSEGATFRRYSAVVDHCHWHCPRVVQRILFWCSSMAPSRARRASPATRCITDPGMAFDRRKWISCTRSTCGPHRYMVRPAAMIKPS